jgi:hypothetical protein
MVRHVAGAERRSGQRSTFEAVQRSPHVGRSEFEGATIPAGEGMVNTEYPDPSESSQCADNSVHRVSSGNLGNLYLLITTFPLCQFSGAC